MLVAHRAQYNFEHHIQQNRYPGRGLVIGRSAVDDAWYLLYWIMGRSEHSRNRRFVIDGSIVRTEPLDWSLVKDPSLIIYDAMSELPSRYLVSNGDQTLTLYDTLLEGGSFDDAMARREREPDAPNYTPRITALLDLRDEPELMMSILKAGQCDPAQTDRTTFRPALPTPGLGYGLTTYAGDGNPLPSFTGDPLVLPLSGGPEEVLETYWNALDQENRISLVLRRVVFGEGSTFYLKNRYE